MAAEAAPPTLQVSGAARTLDGQKVLDRVSLTVGAGEVYALVGRNGAGKSTLAKAVIGALSLDDGRVLVLGRDPAVDRRARRGVGVAPQEIALYGHLTIRENLDVFAALAGVARAERAQAALSAMIDAACLERQDQRIDRLSGGWRRRANLAAAIVHRPHLLILDEPTEGLDAEMKGALRVLIDTLRERRTAVLLISHDSEDVAALADRVGVLDRGRLVAEGSARALMTEAFGQRREISVRLAAPCDAALGALRLFGLKASPGGTDFSALVDDASSLAPRIDQALRAAGAPACELSVRSPGLEALIAWAADRPAA